MFRAGYGPGHADEPIDDPDGDGERNRPLAQKAELLPPPGAFPPRRFPSNPALQGHSGSSSSSTGRRDMPYQPPWLAQFTCGVPAELCVNSGSRPLEVDTVYTENHAFFGEGRTHWERGGVSDRRATACGPMAAHLCAEPELAYSHTSSPPPTFRVEGENGERTVRSLEELHRMSGDRPREDCCAPKPAKPFRVCRVGDCDDPEDDRHLTWTLHEPQPPPQPTLQRRHSWSWW